MTRTLRWLMAISLLMAGCSEQPGAATATAPTTPPRVIPVQVRYGSDASRSLGFTQALRLPWNTTIQLGVHGDLEIDDEGKSNRIIGGNATLRLTDLPKPGLEKTIQVINFDANESTVLVQVEVGIGTALTHLEAAPEKGDPVPTLLDTVGDTYPVIGFMYMDESLFKIRYTPSDPLARFDQLPSLSRSRPKQKLVLFFRVSLGREVKSFATGRVIYEFATPIKCNTPQKNPRW